MAAEIWVVKRTEGDDCPDEKNEWFFSDRKKAELKADEVRASIVSDWVEIHKEIETEMLGMSVRLLATTNLSFTEEKDRVRMKSAEASLILQPSPPGTYPVQIGSTTRGAVTFDVTAKQFVCLHKWLALIARGRAEWKDEKGFTAWLSSGSATAPTAADVAELKAITGSTGSIRKNEKAFHLRDLQVMLFETTARVLHEALSKTHVTVFLDCKDQRGLLAPTVSVDTALCLYEILIDGYTLPTTRDGILRLYTAYEELNAPEGDMVRGPDRRVLDTSPAAAPIAEKKEEKEEKKV